jgi:hypothetical protein
MSSHRVSRGTEENNNVKVYSVTLFALCETNFLSHFRQELPKIKLATSLFLLQIAARLN